MSRREGPEGKLVERARERSEREWVGVVKMEVKGLLKIEIGNLALKSGLV